MIVKISRIVVVVLSVVSMLSTGCATIPGYKPLPAEDDSSALTEDRSFARTEDNSSASGYPAITRDLQKLTWHIGPEVYYYRYKEPGLMEEEGMFYGLNLGFTLRNWLPASPDLSSQAMDIAFFKLMLRGEARFAFGEVDYDGGYSDGTPLTIDNIDDYTFEVRLLLGPDFPTETTLFTLFTGLGYRYLNDDSTFFRGIGPGYGGGYERESQYLYLPLGAEMTNQLGRGWSWGLAAEFDVFLWGNQRSHIASSWGWDEFVDNYQPRGYGLRASVTLQKKGDKIDFIIEPFIRYWDVNESDLDWWGTGLEPTNNTVEAGVRLILAF